MENYQKALNYETVVSVLGKSDSHCWDQFLQISNECDVREELPYNIATYSRLLGVDQNTLQDSYSKCRRQFERLDPRATIIDCTSHLWPMSVKDVPFLYLMGDSSLLSGRSIAVVGTRTPSNHGMSLAREVVDSLGAYGFTIMSGLAMGIDGVSHIEALSKDFKTIGVIGTSICDVYPPKHVKLQGLVAENGLLVSRFAPSRTVQRYFFMQRNLLMAQISLGSFVVEDRDGGGAVQQARYTEKQGNKVFILKETFENRTFLWPRKFKEPVIVNQGRSAGSAVRKALQTGRSTPKISARKRALDVQPELF